MCVLLSGREFNHLSPEPGTLLIMLLLLESSRNTYGLLDTYWAHFRYFKGNSGSSALEGLQDQFITPPARKQDVIV